jgi:hypothetical protein
VRSAHGGHSWELVNRPFIGHVDLLDLHGITLGSPQAEVVFIANRVGVWRSRDRGEQWENLHLEKFSPLCYSRGVLAAPNDPDTLDACVGRNFGSDAGVGVYTALSWKATIRGVVSTTGPATIDRGVMARHARLHHSVGKVV